MSKKREEKAGWEAPGEQKGNEGGMRGGGGTTESQGREEEMPKRLGLRKTQKRGDAEVKETQE